MASISEITARLTLNARDFTSKFDGAIDQATARARSGGAQVGKAFSETAGGGLRDFAGRVPGVGAALTGLSGPALLVGAGFGAIASGAAFALANTDEYIQSARQLDAVLKATGNNTGFTANQLKNYADELETALAIPAESILKTQQVLATFDGVAGTTFKRAITAAADLAATYGGDLAGNAEKLGVVLQNLASGNVEGLSKGFKFLGTTTLDAIAALAKSGDTAAAQTALLDALQKKVGGSGAAVGDSLAGSFFRLQDAIGDASRELAINTGLYSNTVAAIDFATGAIGRYIEKVKEAGESGQVLRLLFFGANSVVTRPKAFDSAAAQGGLFANDPLGGGGIAKFGEDRSARAAAGNAKAEGDAARAAEAGATAHEKAAKEAERAAAALVKQKETLSASLADMEFQAKAAGMTRDQAELLGALRRAEITYGKLLSDNDRKRIGNAIELRQINEAGRVSDDARLKDLAATPLVNFDALGKQASDFYAGVAKSQEDARQQGVQDFRYLSDAFFEVFSGRSGNIWGKFKELGARTLAELASQFVLGGSINLGGTSAGGLLKSIAGAIGGGGGGNLLGTAGSIGGLASAAGGAGAGGLLAAGLGAVSISTLGVAAAIAGVGALIAAIIPGITRRGFANISTDATGTGRIDQVLSRGKGADKSAKDARAQGEAAITSLAALAQQLGGTVAAGVNLGAIGQRAGKFEVKSGTVQKGAYGGGTTQVFGTAEEAAVAFLQQAVQKGAIAGIDASVSKLLSAGDLNTQTGKAVILANALKQLNGENDPITAAVKALNDEFTRLRDIMAEAGSSAADVAKASALYDTRLQAIRDSTAQATSTLKNFLNDLGFGSNSPLALGDQRAAALANYQAATSGIGSAAFDQQAFVAAGQRLLDIERELFGGTADFFTAFRQVQDDTNRAITGINSAASIDAANPFARATADSSAATANNTAALLATQAALPAAIAAAIEAAGLGGGGARGGGFIGGDARGFANFN